MCGEGINDGQATEHSDNGLVHAECPTPEPKSLCELRPGIGLCDSCTLPKWPQEYVGLGCMLCLDCLAKEEVANKSMLAG
jgi:hypothetical protein